MNASAHLNAVWACDTSACDSCNGSQVDFSSGNGVCAPVVRAHAPSATSAHCNEQAGTQNSIRINFFRTVLDIPVQLSLFNGTTKFDYECYRDLGLNTSTGNVNVRPRSISCVRPYHSHCRLLLESVLPFRDLVTVTSRFSPLWRSPN